MLVFKGHNARTDKPKYITVKRSQDGGKTRSEEKKVAMGLLLAINPSTPEDFAEFFDGEAPQSERERFAKCVLTE